MREKAQTRGQLAITDDPRWRSLTTRDKTADGGFWYSVATTGVYCRPSCPSRLPSPTNVTFHDTPEAARQAGFRPCKRCLPDAPAAGAARVARTTMVVAACRFIEARDEEPSLAELAALAGLSPTYFQRVFKAETGLTPKAYALARKDARLRDQLSRPGAVTTALYEAGFNASSRFYERSGDILGMTPTRYRGGGAAEELRFAIGQSSLGAVLVASSARGVAAILIGNDPEILARDLQDRFPKARLIGADADYEATVAKAVSMVEAPQRGVDLPLDIRGTMFQRRVWQALQAIPAGKTMSYAELACQIDRPEAARAVAGACAANNIAVAIPCHRIVRRDGAISGYAWGVERKRALLDREKGAVSPTVNDARSVRSYTHPDPRRTR